MFLLVFIRLIGAHAPRSFRYQATYTNFRFLAIPHLTYARHAKN